MNITGLQLVKKFPAFHGTRRFITALNKRPPPVSILGQPNPVHIPTSYVLEIHPNIIHPSMLRSPQCSLSLRLPHQDPLHPLSSPIRATCPAYLILLDFITRTILGEEYKSFNSSFCSLLQSPATSSLLGPNILNTMFSHMHRTRHGSKNVKFLVYLYIISGSRTHSQSCQEEGSIAFMLVEIKMRTTPCHDSTNNKWRLTHHMPLLVSHASTLLLTCNRDTQFRS